MNEICCYMMYASYKLVSKEQGRTFTGLLIIFYQQKVYTYNEVFQFISFLSNHVYVAYRKL